MGNRAVITTEARDLGVYVHWNGSRDSVEAFLLYCKLKGYRCPENDCYGWARLCQVIGNFFGGECSVGIDRYNRLDCDNGDNGVYIIKNWEIIDKEFEPLEDRNKNNFTATPMEINHFMPINEQIDDKELEEKIAQLFVSPITNKQIRAIHAVVNELGWTDLRYRDTLRVLFRVDTCEELTEQQASILIETLNKIKDNK